MNLIVVGLIILTQSFSILCAVYVGYKIAFNGFYMALKCSDRHNLDIEPEDIPDNFIERLFGKKPIQETEIEKEIDEDLDDKRKTHAFYD